MRKKEKQYKIPLTKWKKEIIEEEKNIVKEYSLKNKKEFRKVSYFLNKIKNNLKNLTEKYNSGSISALEIINKIKKRVLKYFDLEDNIYLTNNIYNLKEEDVLKIQLQNKLFEKFKLNSLREARLLIVHKKVLVNGKLVKNPSYKLEKTDIIDLKK